MSIAKAELHSPQHYDEIAKTETEFYNTAGVKEKMSIYDASESSILFAAGLKGRAEVLYQSSTPDQLREFLDQSRVLKKVLDSSETAIAALECDEGFIKEDESSSAKNALIRTAQDIENVKQKLKANHQKVRSEYYDLGWMYWGLLDFEKSFKARLEESEACSKD